MCVKHLTWSLTRSLLSRCNILSAPHPTPHPTFDPGNFRGQKCLHSYMPGCRMEGFWQGLVLCTSSDARVLFVLVCTGVFSTSLFIPDFIISNEPRFTIKTLFSLLACELTSLFQWILTMKTEMGHSTGTF